MPSRQLLKPVPEHIRNRLPSLLDLSNPAVIADLSNRLETYYTRKQSHFEFKEQSSASILIPLCLLDDSNGSSAPHPAVIFTVRNRNLRTHAGEVSFPGGQMDREDLEDCATSGDPAEMHCAIRETCEEITSFKEHQVRKGILGRLPSMSDRTRRIRVHPYVGYVGLIKKSFQINGGLVGVQWSTDEVDYVFCMTIRDLLDPQRSGVQYMSEGVFFPFWRGPLLHHSSPETNISNIAETNSSNSHETNNRASGKRGFKDDNVVTNDVGEEYYKIWGLSAYVLSDFCRTVLVPMLLSSAAAAESKM